MAYYLGKFPKLGPAPHRPHIPGGNLVTQYRSGSRSEECVAAYRDYHKNYAQRRRANYTRPRRAKSTARPSDPAAHG